MSFGVAPQGFVRKGLQDILTERETANRGAFGPGIVQTPQTPTGQLNGLWSDAESELWELAESIYSSFDPNQAEGLRLDDIGLLRLIERLDGETDDSFAKAITNAGIGRISDADFYRAIRSLSGVTWARIIVNDAEAFNNSLAPHTITVAALGGNDEAIALEARKYIVPGVGSSGNTPVETMIDGFCRLIRIHRPTQIDTKVRVTITKSNDRQGCPQPPNATIATTILAVLQGDERPANGEAVTAHKIRLAVADFPTIEGTKVEVKKGLADYADAPVAYEFNEIASFGAAAVTIIVSDGGVGTGGGDPLPGG